MGLSTLVGVIQNSIRSQPMPLILNDLSGTAGGSDSTGAAGLDPAEDFVTIEQVKQALDDPSTFIIDARADKAFDDGHISGALNVPYDRFPEFYDYLMANIPMESTVICYCWSPTCDFSDQLAQELKFMGYTDVLIFREGWDAWQEAGYPSEP
jgi:rhodanese-related sulfurtransferase